MTAPTGGAVHDAGAGGVIRPPDGRVAVYYAPDAADPLWRAGCGWLGRDAAGAVAPARPVPPERDALTARPRGYGFHATLKPPFRPRAGVGWQDVLDATRALCRAQTPFALPMLHVGMPGGYLALVAGQECAALRRLAEGMVAGLDRLRAAPAADELARRRAAGLTAGQEAMLRRWGYPDVFAEWRFHMTLSERLTAAQADLLKPAAERHFSAACALPRRVDGVCLFVQQQADTPFVLAERVAFGG